VLGAILPLRRLDVETVIDLVYRLQQRNYAAARAHRRRRARPQPATS
jgi:hypothetical protein